MSDERFCSSTDEITKTLIVAGGEDTIDMAVSLIQTLWDMEYKQWEVVVADIERSIQKTILSRLFSQTLQRHTRVFPRPELMAVSE